MHANISPNSPVDELKFMPFDQTVQCKEGQFEGYASRYNIVDLNGDKIVPGAFHKSLQKRPARDVKLLFQHDPHRPIGLWERIVETPKGLYCKGRFLTNIQAGHDAFVLLKEGALDGLSIGFRPTKARVDPSNGVRSIIQADLFEISLVTFPMNLGAKARALTRKAGGFARLKDFERWLVRDAGFTRNEAKKALTHGLKSFAVRETRRQTATKPELVRRLHTATQTLNTCFLNR